jgi:hypothetical protein
MKKLELSENSTVYNSLSSAIASASIECNKRFNENHSVGKFDFPTDQQKIARALSETIRSFIFLTESHVICEMPNRKLEEEMPRYSEHLIRSAIYRMAEELYSKGFFEVREVNQFKNLGLRRNEFVITLPVFKWNKLADISEVKK